MGRIFGILALICGLLVPLQTASSQDGGFSDWSVAILAADWRSSDGRPITAFDNARRDLEAGFVAAGFNPDNTIALTLRPQPDGSRVTALDAIERMGETLGRTPGGCLIYFTSHGSPAGIVMGVDGGLAPTQMDALVDSWCGQRPTVVVVSACFSGVFVPALAAPNRMVVTAARRDRSSFGCSEDATYPYFDGCILESLPQAGDLIALARAAEVCVARREREEGLTPPSNPQVSIGADMQMLLPFLRFSRPAS